ncbi:4-hydroxy-3-methylbut-2-enyl diphosphate reductase [Spiroplasma alleghenense]|uniref:4-hydroxy-3-methylbut-2-enyl diphosphate reductase n=1 Tax=Spiroplasma alleghenense TaxID=216931 RepID=A0A345Z3D2_9MOLU|nr:4-hydroxy-3-methylbut-2-enyl diphosphate reductase [Spiroplasma alleghenense]AXK51111.1 4-hydroxy-3-methylbut-2-enyl diphosphate reductase [Spiroplasma alleghenense]
MNVIRVTPRGFCLGVVKSIKIARETVKKYPDKKIYMIGKIVHNDIIVKEFIDLGVILLDDRNESRLNLVSKLESGSVVIFSAHGTDSKVINQSEKNGLIVVDTKCEWVLKTEELINDYLKNNWSVIFVGKNSHPETIALTSISEKITLITSANEVNDLNVIENSKIIVTNQTTLSKIDTEFIFKAIKEKYPKALIKNDLCDATLERQEAVLKLNQSEVDLLLVVGDKKSNNSNKLVEIGTKKGIKSLLIQSKSDIKPEILRNIKNVAVTAGASTPSFIQLDVIKFLENY